MGEAVGHRMVVVVVAVDRDSLSAEEMVGMKVDMEEGKGLEEDKATLVIVQEGVGEVWEMIVQAEGAEVVERIA